MSTTLRPSHMQAKQVISDFLQVKLGAVPRFGMVEDGDEGDDPQKIGWAFWVYPEELPLGTSDTTSYVHADLSIEWYGTSWESGREAGA